MDSKKLKTKIKHAFLNYDDEDREIELRKQKTREALRKLQKTARNN